MFVEDERILGLMLRSILLEIGAEVCGAAVSGEEALQQIESAQPDVLLMDVRLAGELDGIDTVLEIYKSRYIPSIFLSAYTDPSTLERMRAVRPFAVLAKPVDQAMLISCLKQLAALLEED